ncbi:hypothetical protein ACFYN3_10980 [Streptomyces lavendulae]|uniref:hypothetical protein n=1 Tax=Streptomyces lavendulae TaxID=1914 RepID=UPI0033E40188
MSALAVGRFLGSEELGAATLAEIIAQGGPSTATSEDIENAKATIEKILTANELRGGRQLGPSRHVPMKEVIDRLMRTEIEQIHDVRHKIMTIATLGSLHLRLRGDGWPRIRDKAASSHTHWMLFYGAIPIAETLEANAWHTLTALLAMILADDDARELTEALDDLVHASLPGR